MGRPRKFDEREALAVALDELWAKGYEATSTTALAARMGIGAQSLYNTFGDKQALFERAMALYVSEFIDRMLGPMEAPDAGLAAVRAYFEDVTDKLATPVGARGCFVVKTAMERTSPGDALAEIAQAHFRRIEDALAHALENAVVAGELRPDPSPRALARHLAATAAGLSTLARSGTDARALKETARVALSVLR
ncbi:MAG: TetR/AcrR family transcriptional regulator [Myxococcales bacterium]|nr:TetR/AcrR family transcriptional regulator [Myxococcales bacterium]MCB9648852.1 TetR/AcrR family transcriptional regulator [Deltaproteobacteria bacterium]